MYAARRSRLMPSTSAGGTRLRNTRTDTSPARAVAVSLATRDGSGYGALYVILMHHTNTGQVSWTDIVRDALASRAILPSRCYYQAGKASLTSVQRPPLRMRPVQTIRTWCEATSTVIAAYPRVWWQCRTVAYTLPRTRHRRRTAFGRLVRPASNRATCEPAVIAVASPKNSTPIGCQ
jgi:hypothetical protein